MPWTKEETWDGLAVKAGGKLTIESGGEVDVESGASLKIAGVAVTATAAQINALPPNGVEGLAASYKLARGQHTTIDENDTVVTGLTTVVAVVASLDSDPVDGCMEVTASIGNQSGAPAAGSVYIKTWKRTDADETPVAATTFTKLVNWIAVGT